MIEEWIFFLSLMRLLPGSATFSGIISGSKALLFCVRKKLLSEESRSKLLGRLLLPSPSLSEPQYLNEITDGVRDFFRIFSNKLSDLINAATSDTSLFQLFKAERKKFDTIQYML